MVPTSGTGKETGIGPSPGGLLSNLRHLVGGGWYHQLVIYLEIDRILGGIGCF